MPRIAVTGHMNLTAETVELVRQHIAIELAARPAGSLTGISCIAAGSDSIFAEEILAAGGELEVIVPSADYRQAKVKHDHAALFDSLRERATTVRVMPHASADRAAYESANEALLASCDHLITVWDSQPSGGKGGTADTVSVAKARGIPVTVIWPEGARRS